MYFKLTIPTIFIVSLTTYQAIAAPQIEMMKDIFPGVGSSVPHVYGPTTPKPMPVFVNGTFYFNANDGVHGEELWQSDGTANGTTMIKDLLPGENGSTPNDLTVIGDDIFLSTYSETIDEKKYFELIKFNTLTKEFIVLKKSEGIVWPSGHHLRPLWNSPSPFRALTNVDGRLFFFDYDEYKLFQSNGTVDGTTPMTIELPATEFQQDFFSASNWIVINDTVVFLLEGSLWKLNEEKTKAIEIYKHTISSSLIKIDETLYFTSEKGFLKYDGSEMTEVTLIKNLANISELINIDSILFFKTASMNDLGDSSTTIWKSDGTEAGTSQLKADDNTNFYHNLTNVNGTLFFYSFHDVDDSGTSDKVYELWKSDGSVTGAKLVKKIAKEYRHGQTLRSYMQGLKNTLFFTVYNELWKSDGTEAGTKPVQQAGLEFTYIYRLANINNSLFFLANDSIHGTELWKLDDNSNIDISATPAVCELGLDPQIIKKGEGTALWWWSQNATTGSINNGMGDVTVPSGYKWIYPSETTAYTMTVKGANGTTSTCEATIVVEAGSPPPVCEMGADPQVITAGEGTALWWWSQNVASATINNEKWLVAVPSDYTWFYPSETATYTMTAMGEDGSTTSCNTTITVEK
jgi:ELWxxDGT repeat protein